jgi:hypothetical protein
MFIHCQSLSADASTYVISTYGLWQTRNHNKVRGPFEKFVDSPYFESDFEDVRWRSLFRSTSLGMRCTSYNAPPTSRKRAADRRSLPNFLPRSFLFMVGKAQKSRGARSEFNSMFGLENWIGGTPLEHPPYSPDLAPMRFLDFSNHEKELRGKKFRSNQWSVARFREVGGAL